MRGVCYVAYGEQARREMSSSMGLLHRHTTLEIASVSDGSTFGQQIFAQPLNFDQVQRSRWAKVNLDQWSPFYSTLYLDADTRIYADVSAGFEILDAGWDMAISYSIQQGEASLRHIGEEDRRATLRALCCAEILQLQAGVMFFNRSAAIKEFFSAWRREWLRFKGQDQGALLRALERVPLKVWLLGREWNGGAVIGHRFGMARQRGSSGKRC